MQNQVEVAKFKRRWSGARLHLKRPEGKVLRVQFDRSWRDDAVQLNQVLSSPQL